MDYVLTEQDKTELKRICAVCTNGKCKTQDKICLKKKMAITMAKIAYKRKLKNKEVTE